MTQPPPIVPGPAQPEEPTQWQDITPPLYAPYVPPAQPQVQRTRPVGQPGGPQDTAKKAAVGTVTVVAVLLGLFCGVPVLLCLIMSAVGAVGNAVAP